VYCDHNNTTKDWLCVSQAVTRASHSLGLSAYAHAAALLQASCRFCATPAVPAGSIVLTEQPAAAAAAAGLLHWAPDQCQDDISVCPFLSRSGLCSSSTWARVQCPSSCAACRQSNSGQAGLGSSKAGQGSQATASRGPVMCGVPHLGAVGGASPGATLQGAAAGGATDTTTAAAAAANGHAKAPNVVCTTLTTLQRPRCDDQQKVGRACIGTGCCLQQLPQSGPGPRCCLRA
jgi:hypothetical protein